MKILQKGFNYSQDGPGNRLVYHLQGCNFRCKWCSNPESMFADEGGFREYSVMELFDEASRSKMMYFDGGGVTFTGGECTMQYIELLELLKLLKADGIHTAIETNGSSEHLIEIAEYVDYLIMDFKHFDCDTHKKWTGVGNETVKSNLEYFLNNGRQLHIRIPLIHGVNDNPDGFVDYFKDKDMKNAVLELLPYHEYGKDKWTRKYEITDGFVSEETIRLFEEKLSDIGITLVKT